MRSAKEIMKKKMMDNDIFVPLVEKTFEELDLNNSGFIEIEEFTPIIKDIHKTLHLPPPKMKEIKNELSKIDIDKDGKLSKNEYKELIQDLILYTIDLL